MSDGISIRDTRINIILGDITTETVDVIVNAANSGLLGGGGVDGAIHRAGGSTILEECKQIVAKIGRLPAGQAVITAGGNLPARYVIHTVGPVWHGGKRGEADILASCYLESLMLASDRNLNSIAFPAISTGVYGYPPHLASEVAIGTVTGYINSKRHSLNEVHFVLFDKGSYDIYLNNFRK